MSEVRAPRRAAAAKAVVGPAYGTLGAAVAIDSPRDPINILIVDDEPKNLVVLQSILDEPDYRLVCAESAEQALLSLIFEQYALLILDVRMPGMTGFELTQIIKERKKTAQAPIIFLTAYYGEDQHMLEGNSAGAVDYLHKPVNASILRSKVAVFAELYRKNRDAVQSGQALLAEVGERRRADEKLRELNETLEQRVADWAAELLESRARLRHAADLARLTYFDLDYANGRTESADNFKDLIGTRIVSDAPSVRLTAAGAQAMGMALHEIATNAAKYGSLSGGEGIVEISWRISSDADPMFSVQGKEQGGPPVAAPTRKGFGQLVIGTLAESAFAGTVELEFSKEGLVWNLRARVCDALEIS